MLALVGGQVADLVERLEAAEQAARRQGADISTHQGAIKRRVKVIEERLYGRPVIDPD
jgi:hypothetical protein